MTCQSPASRPIHHQWLCYFVKKKRIKLSQLSSYSTMSLVQGRWFIICRINSTRLACVVILFQFRFQSLCQKNSQSIIQLSKLTGKYSCPFHFKRTLIKPEVSQNDIQRQKTEWMTLVQVSLNLLLDLQKMFGGQNSESTFYIKNSFKPHLTKLSDF